MSRPLLTPPSWATNLLFPAGAAPWSGTALRVVPTSGEILAGSTPGGQLPAQTYNHLIGLTADHVRHLATIPILNWRRVDFSGTTANVKRIYATGPSQYRDAAFNARHVFASTRLLGSEDFWRSRQGETWNNPATTATQHRGVAAGLGGNVTVVRNAANADHSTDFGATFSSVAQHVAGYNDIDYDWKATEDSGGAVKVFYAGLTIALSNKIGVTTDGGATWAAVAGAPPGAWSTFVNTSVRAYDGNLVVFRDPTEAALDTVIYSLDAGATWAISGAVFGSGSTKVSDVRFCPGAANGAGLWVAVSHDGRCAVSADQGATWSVRHAALVTPSSTFFPRLATDDGGIWVMTCSTTSNFGLFISTDQGITWLFVALEASAPVDIFYGGGHFYVSTQGAGANPGEIWKSVAAG